MSARPDVLRYRTRGGVITTAELRLLADAASARGDGRVYATSRQEFGLRGISAKRAATLLAVPTRRLLPGRDDTLPTVVTTAPVAGMPQTREWLSEGIFTDILGGITQDPSRPVALSDPMQSYLPAIMGAINFLALEQRDLWQVYLAGREDGESISLPGAIRSKDIPDFVHGTSTLDTRANERFVQDITTLFEQWRVATTCAPAQFSRRYVPPPGALAIAIEFAGISSEFVSALCVSAAHWPGVSFGLTPWSALLVKGATEQALGELRALMLRHRVSEACAPWRQHLFVADGCAPLAREVCSMMAARCAVSAGYALAILDAQTVPPDVHVIVRESGVRGWWPVPHRTRYDVFRRDDTVSRTLAWTRAAAAVRRDQVAEEVLSALAPRVESQARLQGAAATETATPRAGATAGRGHCKRCLTIYDAAYGDPSGAITKGVSFAALPPSWQCPVCGAPKTDYVLS